MKTLKSLLFILLFFNLAVVFGQSKIKKSGDIVLEFDYKEKIWNYAPIPVTDKHKPYFLLRYKSQPVIKIKNLPTSSKVTIEEYFYDVTPEVENKDNSLDKSQSDGLIATPFIQTMAIVDSDEVSYKVTIKDDNDTTLHTTTTAFAKVYGRWKIDLSTGVLFHNLQNESYYFSDSGNEQSSILKDSNKGKIKPLFPAVLTHFYKQGKGFTNFGASVGFGIDDSGKIGYYAGPSLIVGDRQRVILSGGWAFRPTDVLKGKYKEGQLLNTSNLPEVAELVESEYKSGIFLSLTYNLTSKVEKR
ncbi:hypothetical protein J2X69_004926 [Algoriphagus sp. 4150]|uniref:hypothetical protein n=1 Tax=Algoriphagus sp. 4150 TaxID=2817756 RepID=UPI00285DCCBF|nr:hypothetical protein [Algoriphagus sp. 4150]MDR7132553.1 hypothetical protein [Algoriphagus sp. 4150]